ncbi:MAG: hypothetical protein ABWX67_00125 [Allosphingosinicella sp.]
MRNRILMVALATAGMTIGFATPASAQATRTWVSGVGDDVNPCSRTAPCKTFAGAISKTAAGGEINCLDPGGFGAVTIIKSMTISCPYTEGGALAGGNGVVVNMPLSTDVTVLRGLDIFGVNPPSNGVRFINQGSLHIEDTVIRRFNAASSFGVSFQPSTGVGNLHMSNVTVTQNGSGATGGGVLVKPTSVGVARVVMDGVKLQNNASSGLSVDTTGYTGAGIALTMNNTLISGTTGNGILALAPPATSAITMMVTNSLIANNSAIGLGANGSTVLIRVGNTTITGNSFVAGSGVVISNGAIVNTYGDNRLDGNNSNGAFTPGAIPKQ